MNIGHIIANEDNLKMGKHMPPLRYETFQRVLSKNNSFYFIPYNEFRKGLESNDPIRHYHFKGKEFVNEKTIPMKLDIAQIEYYDAPNPEQKILDMYQRVPVLAQSKNIQLINNAESLKSQDKKFIYDFQEELLIKPPKTHHCSNQGEMLDTLQYDSFYVLKPRLGSESKGIELLKGHEISEVPDIENYIIQHEQKNIIGELRLVFGMGKFLGSRFMLDRKKPWELKQDKSQKKFSNIPIKPSQEIISYANQIYEFSKCEFSAVDLYVISPENKVSNPSEEELQELLSTKSQLKLVEVNGFGTGYGNPPTTLFARSDNSIGDLNEIVATSIANIGHTHKTA